VKASTEAGEADILAMAAVPMAAKLSVGVVEAAGFMVMAEMAQRRVAVVAELSIPVKPRPTASSMTSDREAQARTGWADTALPWKCTRSPPRPTAVRARLSAAEGALRKAMGGTAVMEDRGVSSAAAAVVFILAVAVMVAILAVEAALAPKVRSSLVREVLGAAAAAAVET
jgi:hypothetical protein